MKRIFLTLYAIIISAIGAFAQNRLEARSKLLKVANNNLPQTVYGICTVHKFSIKSDTLFCKIEFDDNKIDFNTISQRYLNNRDKLFEFCVSSLPSLSNMMITSDIVFDISISATYSKQSYNITYNRDEIKRLSKKSISTKELLTQEIEVMNKNLPTELEKGSTLIHLQLYDNFLCYKINLNEQEAGVSIGELKKDSKVMKQILSSNLNNTSDPYTKVLIKNLKDLNIGVRYIFYSINSDEIFIVDISPDELIIRP